MIKHAIVGAGFGASVHYPAFQSAPGIKLVALCDSGSGHASTFATEGVSAYSDWHSMLDIEQPESLSVVSPPTIQYEIVSEALRRKIHILCEKPFGTGLCQANAMESARAEANLVGFVGFQFRYEPGIARMKEMLDRQSIGELQRLDVTWLTSGRADPERPWTWQHDATQGGGVINAFASHVFDLLMWLSGRNVSSVRTLSRVLIPERVDRKGARKKVTAEDSFDAVLEWGGKISSTIRISNCIRYGTGMRLEAFGSGGSIRFKHTWPFTEKEASLVIHNEGGEKHLNLSSNEGRQNEDSRIVLTSRLVKDYCKVLAGEPLSSHMPTFDDAVKVQKVIDLIRYSPVNSDRLQA